MIRVEDLKNKSSNEDDSKSTAAAIENDNSQQQPSCILANDQNSFSKQKFHIYVNEKKKKL